MSSCCHIATQKSYERIASSKRVKRRVMLDFGMVDRSFHIQSQWDIIIWTFSSNGSTQTTFAPVVHNRDAKMVVSNNEGRCRITIRVKSRLFAASWWREIDKEGDKIIWTIWEIGCSRNLKS